jgi:hypothetical protein
MLKFNRQYKLSISTVKSTGPTDYVNGIIIDSSVAPLTVEFNFTKACLSSAQNGRIRIYNLSQTHEDSLFKDPFDYEATNRRWIIMEAGYGGNLSVIFRGLMRECTSYRESGQVNTITEIDCYDYPGVFMNSTTNHTFNTCTSQDVINYLVQDIIGQNPGVQAGCIAPVDSQGNLVYGLQYPRGRTVSGDSWKSLMTETHDQGFVEHGVIQLLGDNDVLKPEGGLPSVFTVNSSTGLLSTPKKRSAFLSLDMLFEPTVKLGQLIKLQSLFPFYNNLQNEDNGSVNEPYYKVIGYDHSGVISGAVGGKCVTTIRLNSGSVRFNQQEGTFTKNPSDLASLPL